MIPIVFDFLNIPAQLEYQKESLGAPSPMLKDYTARGLTTVFSSSPTASEPGIHLSWLIDPYSYCYAYTMPKLIVVGSNNPYWTVDATSLYWPGLPNPKNLLVVPNAGHGVLDAFRVLGTISAFARVVARGDPIPELTAEVRFTAGGAVLSVSADRPAIEARLWVAASASRDFRQARWEERDLSATIVGREVAIPSPRSGYLAFFAELVVEVDGLRMYATSPTRVLGP